MDMTDNLLKQRNNMLQLTVMGFSLWQGSWLLMDIFYFVGWPAHIMKTVFGIGGVMFGLSMLRLLQLWRTTRKLKAEAMLGDELALSQQHKAFFLAYFVVSGAAALLLGVEPFTKLQPPVILRTLVILAVITPIITFLWLDHQAGKDGE